MSNIPALAKILESKKHWAFPDKDNSLSLSRVVRLCKEYSGNGSVRDFHEYVCDTIEERLDARITMQIYKRRGEFENGKVEDLF